MGPFPVRTGSRFPPGATRTAEGVNFSVFSRRATGMELRLYEGPKSPTPFQVVPLDPATGRTFFFWHVFVEGLPAGVHYTWRADGPDDPATGCRFNGNRELMDPRALGVTSELWDRRRASDPGGEGGAMRAVVCDPLPPQAGRTQPRGLEGAVIYELHVGGFTRHPSSGVGHPGTFAGLREKIPYLQDLGVTHVELLPVMAFDEQDVPPGVAARGLRNFWGYSTHSFWSPHPGYCLEPEKGRHAREFRETVEAFHAAGIGVILDVVLNHTAEGGADGPWINFRGLMNEAAYLLDPRDRSRYLDYTGCGNTVNCNHPPTTAFLVHCLEYWAEEMGVDGFRFDLASVFARGEGGVVLPFPTLPWAIELSPHLAERPLIAEAWDAAGLYQVGAFPGLAWAEWNGRYRDSVRRFVRGDPGLTGEIATRISGSQDLYGPGGRLPANAINFVTCHDGFTLWDLVSYNGKHNEANGEENRDGTNDNASWNCGAEGPTADPAILALRNRQARNLLAILLLSRGVPMLLAGDEVLRSQGGNNNAYCQANEISWFDWGRVETEGAMRRFVRGMIRLRARHGALTRNAFFTGAPVPGREIPDIAWHGPRLAEPPWQDPGARVLAFTMSGQAPGEDDLHVVCNMGDEPIQAPLPPVAGRRWHLSVDTGREPPGDLVEPDRQAPVAGPVHPVGPRSVAVFEGRP